MQLRLYIDGDEISCIIRRKAISCANYGYNLHHLLRRRCLIVTLTDERALEAKFAYFYNKKEPVHTFNAAKDLQTISGTYFQILSHVV